MGSDQGEGTGASGRALLACPPPGLGAVPGLGELGFEVELEGLPAGLQGRRMPVWMVGVATPALGLAYVGAQLAHWQPQHSLLAALLMSGWFVGMGLLARITRRSTVRLSEHGLRVDGLLFPWGTSRAQVLERRDFGVTLVLETPDGRYVWSAAMADAPSRAWLKDVVDLLSAEGRAAVQEVPEALRDLRR